MTIEEIKLYLGVDNDEEDELLKQLLLASEQYLLNSGCEIDYENELYSLAIKLLISHFYENRTITGENKHLNFSLSSIIPQLKKLGFKDEQQP